MKLKPLIQLFQRTLPKHTDFFSDTINVSSGSITNGLVTMITTNAHKFSTNNYVVINNAYAAISISSFVVLNGIATCKTNSDNGINMAMNYKDNTGNLEVDLIGFDDASFNGTFKLLSVPNKQCFTIKTTIADGTYISDGSIIRYSGELISGLRQITVVDVNTFTYQLTNTSITSLVYGTPKVYGDTRISGANDIVRANKSYSKQLQGKYWIYITYGSSTASKDRNVLNDSVSMFGGDDDFRIRDIQDFDVNIFVPISNDLTGLTARDNIEDIKKAIFKTILRFPQLKEFSNDDNFVYTYVNDFEVIANDAYIIHGFKFSTSYDITFDDTSQEDTYTPFRSIDISLNIGDTTINNEIILE